MKRTVVLLGLLFTSLPAAQNLSGFGVMSLTYKITPKWMAYGELQARSIQDFSIPDYYELKGGIGYNFKKNHQPFIGIGRYVTFRDHDLYQQEIRLWGQYTLTQNVSKLKIDHRVRAEKRFFDYPQTDEKSDTERYRYRLSGTLPLNTEKVQQNTFFLNAFEEIFVGPGDPGFKRNRLFTGMGYQLEKNMGTVIGYMWQREFSTSGNKDLHFLYWGLNFTIDGANDEHREYEIPVAD